MSSKQRIFLDSQNYSTDNCARSVRDGQNVNAYNWVAYQYLPVDCDAPSMRSPNFQYDHPNLRAKVGYGFTDDCLVDEDSKLRINPTGLTHDRCKLQLFERIFQGCPNLKPGVSDPGAELAVQQGTNNEQVEGIFVPCKKALMEKQLYHPTPLVECMKDIQDPNHVVPTWTWGGEPTRDYVRRKEFLNRCGYGSKFH